MYQVLVDMPIHIPIEEVYRYMGFPASYQAIPPALTMMVEEEIAAALPIILPKATYATCEYDAENKRVLLPAPKAILPINGAGIQHHLHECTKVTLFTCTISATIEPVIDTYFKKGEFTRGMILDAIGSAAVEYAADTLNQYVQAAAYQQNYKLTTRFSPGYGDWDLSIQDALVMAAGGAAIGIEVTESSLLIPRKSVSGVIGWMPAGTVQQESRTSPCLICKVHNCNNPICKGGKMS